MKIMGTFFDGLNVPLVWLIIGDISAYQSLWSLFPCSKVSKNIHE